MAISKKGEKKSSKIKSDSSNKPAAKKQPALSKSAASKTNLGVSQSQAVRKEAEVKVGDYQFEASPSGFKIELVTNTSIKRFDGSRLLQLAAPRVFSKLYRPFWLHVPTAFKRYCLALNH